MSLRIDPDTGYLVCPPSFHQASRGELHETFVAPYSPPHRRRRIWHAYEELNEGIARSLPYDPLEQWVNGSFTTKKEHPGDVDLVTFVPVESLQSLTGEQCEQVAEHFQGKETHAEGFVDSYQVPYELDEEGNEAPLTQMYREYWTTWFGRDRSGRRKGIAVVQVGDGSE